MLLATLANAPLPESQILIAPELLVRDSTAVARSV
jgi:hypothetical protein